MTDRRIALVFSGFGQGGVPRVMLTLAGGFIDEGHSVDIVVARNEGPRRADVPEGARVIDLEARHPALSWRRLLRKKRHRVLACVPPLIDYYEAERPAVVLSGGNYINYVALRARARARYRPGLAVSHRSHFSHESEGKLFARWIARRAYPMADAIVAVSDGVAEDLAAGAGLPRERVVTIYNPSVTPEVVAGCGQPPPHVWLRDGGPPVIVAAGRLHPQKDFPTLIRAFAKVRVHRPARLVILGDGPERAALEALAARLGLTSEILLPGFASRPHAWFAHSTAFVLSSAWEGFPNVLAEALACGAPVVSTDCPSGPREILGDSEYGTLVPVGDAERMALAISAALADPGDPGPRRRRAAEFSVPAATARYLALFEGLEKKGRPSEATGADSGRFAPR